MFEKVSFAFRVFISVSNCWKQSHLSNLLYLSKNPPKTNLKVFSYQTLYSVEKVGKRSCQVRLTFVPFWNSTFLILRHNCVKGLIVTKIVKKVKLKPKNKFFQSPSFAKYLRLHLVAMWNSPLREKASFLFFKSFLLVLTKF